MTDTTPAVGAAGSVATDQAPVFQLQRVYLKDASLEMPHAPHIFSKPKRRRSTFS